MCSREMTSTTRNQTSTDRQTDKERVTEPALTHVSDSDVTCHWQTHANVVDVGLGNGQNGSRLTSGRMVHVLHHVLTGISGKDEHLLHLRRGLMCLLLLLVHLLHLRPVLWHLLSLRHECRPNRLLWTRVLIGLLLLLVLLTDHLSASIRVHHGTGTGRGSWSSSPWSGILRIGLREDVSRLGSGGDLTLQRSSVWTGDCLLVDGSSDYRVSGM